MACMADHMSWHRPKINKFDDDEKVAIQRFRQVIPIVCHTHPVYLSSMVRKTGFLSSR